MVQDRRVNSIEFHDIPKCSIFQKRHVQTLISSLQSFYNCPVEIVLNPIFYFQDEYDIDITAKVQRTTYVLSEKKILISLAATVDDSTVAFLGVILKDMPLPLQNTQLLNHIAYRCKPRLSWAMKSNFNANLCYFGTDLILDGIVDHISKGMNRYYVRFLIEAFLELRCMTFEDRPFGTGIILSQSDHLWKDTNRSGILVPLAKEVKLSPNELSNNRLWFLADGRFTFFLCNKNLQVSSIVTLPRSTETEISSISLSQNIQGRDFVLFTRESREVSVLCPNGEEYIYVNAQWRYRDYFVILKQLRRLLPGFSNKATSSLLKIIFRLIENRHSSMLWIPNTENDITNMTLIYNKLASEVNISDTKFSSLLSRFLASDGCLILSQSGNVLGYGAIADLSNVKITQADKTIGSGTTAAQYLSQSGLSIKVSQDGYAKVFANGISEWRI